MEVCDPHPIESPVERQIRQAMERGEFDDLPGAGKPIPGAGEPYDPLWWVKAWVERERLFSTQTASAAAARKDQATTR